ncbi:MAG: DUF3267 domain-containing protein [Oscillospiraceae bacterium]|jgi:hypothetical protein|nr:DUF3267 domain-containing protein [Oscillospiraceae bacterium]
MMNSKEAAKQQRIDSFEYVCAQMREKGFTEELRTISVLKANLCALLVGAPFVAAALGLYAVIRGSIALTLSPFLVLMAILVALLSSVCAVIHELLHGLTWGLFCKNRWKSIHIGVMWNSLTPYCHCKEALSFKAYLFGGLMPFLILGIGLSLLSVLLGNMFLLYLSILNIFGAGGDLTLSVKLFKHRNAWILDHPTDVGFVAFSKATVS